MAMILQISAFSLLWFVQSVAASEPIAAYAQPNVLVVVAEVRHYSRSRGLNSWADGERIHVSNSCGFDTAALDIRQVLLGEYTGHEVSAHLRLGEWCEGLWQESVRSYLVHLEWDGNVWVVDRELSSPVFHRGGKYWIVEPTLLESLRAVGIPLGRRIAFSNRFRVKLSKERLVQVGIEPEAGFSWKEAVIENASRCEVPRRCWTSAPMSYGRTIEVGKLASWLRSNYALKRTAGRSFRVSWYAVVPLPLNAALGRYEL
jgi:hypothetical protein